MQVAMVIAAISIGCGALVAVTIRRPVWGVMFGMVVIYNPIFNYRFLLTHEFEGGSARATLSLVVLACLYSGLATSRARDNTVRYSISRLPWQLLYLVTVLVGAAVGLIAGHDLRLVAADLFPVIEFAAYFPLVAIACRSRDEASQLALGLLLWGGLVAAVEVGLYVTVGDQFYSRFALNGGTTLIHRLDDFIPALLLPLGVCVALMARGRVLRLAATISSIVLAGATVLSFFRSLWIGVFLATALMFGIWLVSSFRRISITKDLMIRAGVVTAIGLAILGLLTLARIPYLFISRLTHIESTSGAARVEDNIRLVHLIWDHPLGIGLGGSSGVYPLFSTSDYYLSTTAEIGIIGLVLTVVMSFTFLRRYYRRFQSENDGLIRAIILGTIGSYACMAGTLLTFPSLLHYPIPAYLAILGGIGSFIGRRESIREISANSGRTESRIPTARVPARTDAP